MKKRLETIDKLQYIIKGGFNGISFEDDFEGGEWTFNLGMWCDDVQSKSFKTCIHKTYNVLAKEDLI